MKKRNKYVILGIFLILGFLILNKTLSELKPIPKVTFKSQNLNYDKSEPGSFKVDKSAKWIGEGKAKITIDVESIMKEQKPNKDIIFLVDVSNQNMGFWWNQVKKDISEFASTVLNDKNNRMALITCNSPAELVVDFTNDKSNFLKKVNNLEARSHELYCKEGYDTIIKLLEKYKRDNQKDLVVLVINNGSLDMYDSYNYKTYGKDVYDELKQKFPYININGVIYSGALFEGRGNITALSDRQFIADMTGVNNVLFDAALNPVTYENFVITDYISKYFKGIASTIKVSQGEAKLDGDQITWNLGVYRTGSKATLEIELEQIGSREELYKTNKGIDIKTSFEKQKDDQISSKTPILKDTFRVIYEANNPQGCTVEGLEQNKVYRPFEKVKLDKGKATCDGYIFQGYELITDAKYINKEYIEMPERDVVLRATWGNLRIDKGLQGKTSIDSSIYNVIKAQSLGNDRELGLDYKEINSPTNGEGVYLFDETKNDKKPVYFFRGTHNLKNNLLYANLCWKIVRTTETGGVRVIYNGTPVNGKCTNTIHSNNSLRQIYFNYSEGQKRYVGYMYGDDLNPYQNINESNIKKYIDTWYKVNVKDKGFETKLDKKSIYCGDRTETKAKGHTSYFAGYYRIKAGKPTLKCPANDSYGKEAGNRKLTHPVGLLSVDEVNLAGGKWRANNNYYYLSSGYAYWILSPAQYDTVSLYGMNITENGEVGFRGVSYQLVSIRPVLTINGLTSIMYGEGSQNSPYVI